MTGASPFVPWPAGEVLVLAREVVGEQDIAEGTDIGVELTGANPEYQDLVHLLLGLRLRRWCGKREEQQESERARQVRALHGRPACRRRLASRASKLHPAARAPGKAGSGAWSTPIASMSKPPASKAVG